MKRAYLAAAGAAVLIAGGLLAAFVWLPAPEPKGAPTASSPEGQTGAQTGAQTAALPSLIIGRADAPVTLVEYGDYQCSSCSKFHKQAYPDLKRDYIDTGKLKIEYRPYPVIGPDSPRAASAAFCSSDQGKFEAFNDTLYRYVEKEYFARGRNGYGAGVYTPDRLSALARQAGLDGAAFDACLASGRGDALTPALVARGEADGVAGTPTFILSGQKIVGPQPAAIFAALIDAELRR